MNRIVIVGGGLGGLRAAEALCAQNWAGSIMLVGAEPHMPYTRPPLSKQFITDAGGFESVAFTPRPNTADIDWRLGTAVEHADLGAKLLRLADGEQLEYDGLVAATGVRSHRIPIPGPTEGRIALRTYDDALKAVAGIARATRILVLGAGFIGCEIAATARALGCEVDVVALDDTAMLVPLGAQVGSAIQRRHEGAGIRFHLGRTIHHFTGTDRVSGAVLDDSTVLATDFVIEAVGSRPNVEWLYGNGLDLSNGVLCDNTLRIAGASTAVAVGDVARFPNPLFDSLPRRVEHWQIPGETARHAAASLIADLGGPPNEREFAPVPSFWSDQGQVRINSFGMPGIADSTELIDGDLDGDAAVAYLRGGEAVGVVLVGMKDRAPHYRKWLLEELAGARDAGVIA